MTRRPSCSARGSHSGQQMNFYDVFSRCPTDAFVGLLLLLMLVILTLVILFPGYEGRGKGRYCESRTSASSEATDARLTLMIAG